MMGLAIGLALAWVTIAVLSILVYHLMRYGGRQQLRIERLESRLGELTAGQDGLSLAPAPKSSGLGRFERESRLARDGLSVGTPAPAFRLPRVGGGELSLEEYRGQSVLLVFSDPGCGPCNQLAPKLERLHRQSLDLEILMVSRGGRAANEAKIVEHGLTFPVVLQRHWEISRLYAMFATPIAYLLDRDLTVTAQVATGTNAIVALALGSAARSPEASRIG
jgi:peroxiredoxin